MNGERYRALLQQRQEELSELLDGAKTAVGPVELDQSRVGRLSRMDALQAQALHGETRRRRELELRRVRAALRRLDTGVFGQCAECEEPIGEARLGNDPSVMLCIECARSR